MGQLNPAHETKNGKTKKKLKQKPDSSEKRCVIFLHMRPTILSVCKVITYRSSISIFFL